jgi:hypothetical protein
MTLRPLRRRHNERVANPPDEHALTIYTDGSSYSGPRRGGVGIVYVTVDDSGHDLHNRAADRLAKQSAKLQTGQRVSIVKARRKKSSRSTELGSVRMLGQRATIHIVTDEYLPIQNCNAYRYEVMSKAAPSTAASTSSTRRPTSLR